MLGKSILIGLFDLDNNRTIGPKYPHGGWEKHLSSHAFLQPVMAGTGDWGWVFAWPGKAGMGVNGLRMDLWGPFLRQKSQKVFALEKP